jgi:hypothetical protein
MTGLLDRNRRSTSPHVLNITWKILEDGGNPQKTIERVLGVPSEELCPDCPPTGRHPISLERRTVAELNQIDREARLNIVRNRTVSQPPLAELSRRG